MKIIPKKFMQHIDEAYKDSEGYWAYAKNGYKFEATDSHTALGYTQKEFLSDIRSITTCQCEECLKKIETNNITDYKSLLSLHSLAQKWYELCIPEISPSYYHDFESIHGGEHVSRVLGLALSIADKMIMHEIHDLSEDDIAIISLSATYHDVGRTHDWIDDEHGYKSFEKIYEEGYLESFLSKHYPTFYKDKDNIEILRFTIENHCLGDTRAYNNLNDYNITNIERAKLIYSIVCDGDNLDRVRLGDLDLNYIRNDISKTLEKLAYLQYEIAPY